MRSVLKQMLPREPRVRRLPVGIGRGLRMTIDFGHQTKLYLGLYEIELNRYLKQYASPGAVSFDVGAREGYDALLLAQLTRGPVVSFECDAEACDAARANVAANAHLAPLVTVRCCTVGASSDDSRAAVALDDVAYGPQGVVPDLVKIDVEGAEADVLRGAQELLLRRKPSLVIETHDAGVENECRSLLEQLGYSLTTVEPRGWLPDHRPHGHNRWLVAPGR